MKTTYTLVVTKIKTTRSCLNFDVCSGSDDIEMLPSEYKRKHKISHVIMPKICNKL